MTPMLTTPIFLPTLLALPGTVTEAIAGHLPTLPDVTGALNDLSLAWGQAIFRASWQAGLLALVAWAVTRRWGQKMPAVATAALWWLVAAKVLIALVWSTPVPLPVLPSSPAVAPLAAALPDHLSPLTAVLQTGNTSGKGGRRGSASPSPSRRGSGSTTSPSSVASAGAAAGSSSSSLSLPPPAPAQQRRTMPTVLTLVFCLWSAGVLCHAGLALRQFRLARALVARAAPLSGATGLAIETEVTRLVERMGAAGRPEVRISTEVSGPLLMGLARTPVILLPAHLVPPPETALTPEELRLVLAHELAHLRRADPLLALVPALAAALFFFHPLVRLATREFDIARESACDAAALSATGDAPERYGSLLLKLGALSHLLPLSLGGGVVAAAAADTLPSSRGRVAHPAGTLAAVSGYASLRRRLTLLQQLLTREGRAAAAPTHRQRIARGLVFFFVATAGLVPWRMVPFPTTRDAAPATPTAPDSEEFPAATRTAPAVAPPAAAAAAAPKPVAPEPTAHTAPRAPAAPAAPPRLVAPQPAPAPALALSPLAPAPAETAPAPEFEPATAETDASPLYAVEPAITTEGAGPWDIFILEPAGDEATAAMVAAASSVQVVEPGDDAAMVIPGRSHVFALAAILVPSTEGVALAILAPFQEAETLPTDATVTVRGRSLPVVGEVGEASEPGTVPVGSVPSFTLAPLTLSVGSALTETRQTGSAPAEALLGRRADVAAPPTPTALAPEIPALAPPPAGLQPQPLLPEEAAPLPATNSAPAAPPVAPPTGQMLSLARREVPPQEAGKSDTVRVGRRIAPSFTRSRAA